MMKLYMSDVYRIDVHYPLDTVQTDILYFLYQPLVGASAMSTYMTMYTEGKRMNRFLKPAPLSRLVSYLSCHLDDMAKNIKTLEGIGLLKTYVKHENDFTHYIFDIQSPLSLQAFFKNQILLTLLQDALSLEDFQKTIQYFQTSREDQTNFEDITASFTDVFEIQHHGTRKLKFKNDFLEKTTKDVENLYDMDLLKRGLHDYQVPSSYLSKEDMIFIAQLGSVYAIDGMTLASFVKDAMTSQSLDRKCLKNKIKNYYEINEKSSLKEVYHKQPLQYQTKQTQNDPITLHMKYLDSITPYELLRDKQGGKEPVFHDLKIVETLMTQLALQPAVVNVILEYVLGKNQGRLSKAYCESIGATFARKHIETAMDAYHAFMNEEDNQKIKVESVIEEPIDYQPNEDEFEQLLNELKEGQL